MQTPSYPPVPDDEMMDEAQDAPAFRMADILLLVPFLWQLGLAPFANDVAWRPFGLPFPMLWQMVGILVATLAIGLRYAIGERGPDGRAL